MNTNKTLSDLYKERAELEQRRAELKTRIDRIKAKKRAAELERRKKEFAKLPEAMRSAFKRVGWDPIENNESRVLIRECGPFTVKG